MRRRVRRVATVVVAGFAVACGGQERRGTGAAQVPDSARYGGTAVVAYLVEPSSLNHFASTDNISLELQNHVLFTTLIRYSEDLRPVPYLAERWDTTATAAGLRLTFHLRDDVRWHDGQATTAHDVEFTFDRIKDPVTAYPNASLLSLYDSATVVDSLTISFYLRRHPGFLDPWRIIPPMPRHLLEDVPASELRAHRFGAEPVGNGPFRFVEHRADDRWIFAANPDFSPELGGRPYLDRLVYRVIVEPTTRIAEHLAGDVDVYLAVDPSQAETIEADPGTRILSYPTRNYILIAWNGQRALFTDSRVRRALTMGIDRGEIVDVVRQGYGEIAKGPVPPFHWAHHEELEPLPYDPTAARALLDSAGWIDRDGDGVRERDVVSASFELKTHPSPSRQDIMTLVQADLAEIGIEARLRVQEAQSLARDVTSPERNFDAVVIGWAAEFNLDDRIQFACSQIGGAYQWASYCNPRVDELLDQVATIEERARSLPLWHEYQEILQWEQPYTFLYYEVRPNGVRDRVRDVRMDIRGSLINVGAWWIAAADRREPPTPTS